MSSTNAKRTLTNGGVTVVRINGWSYAVEEADLEAFLARRAGYSGRGRPRRPRDPGNDEPGATAPDSDAEADPGTRHTT